MLLKIHTSKTLNSRVGGFWQKLLSTFLSITFFVSSNVIYEPCTLLPSSSSSMSYLTTHTQTSVNGKEKLSSVLFSFLVPFHSSESLGMWQVWDGRLVGWAEPRRPWGRGKTGSPLMPLNFRVSLRELFVWLSSGTQRCLGFTRPWLPWNDCCVSGLVEKWLCVSVCLPVCLCLHMPMCVPRCLVNCSLYLFVLCNFFADLFFLCICSAWLTVSVLMVYIV